MASPSLLLRVNTLRPSYLRLPIRSLSTLPAATPTTASTPAPPPETEPLTHFRITLRRSAIGLPQRIKGTLVSLGLHRRMQTVYHEHNSINAGKILRVKELVQVENVPTSAVRTKTEQRQERKAVRGYAVVGSQLGDTLGL